jgi:hypothetical protein
LQFGETNAGEPYRLTFCALVRAMGIIVGKAEYDKEETRWAGLGMQQAFIAVMRKTKIGLWNQRYLQYKGLLDSIVKDAQGQLTADHIPRPIPTTGKFVTKPKKTFVPIILFVVLSLYYAFITAPYYAAQSNPLRNVHRLQIKVANFESSGDYVIGTDSTGSDVVLPKVGDLLVTFLQTVQQNTENIATMEFVSSSDTTASGLRDGVLDQEAWATVYVNTNATLPLIEAIQGGCLENPSKAASFNSRQGIVFEWDEGRNPGVAGPYIAGFMRNALLSFSYSYDRLMLTALQNAVVTNTNTSYLSSCVDAGYQSLISRPVAFTEINLTPVSISPVISAAGILVGQIFVAVFGANFIVSATYANTGALAEEFSPRGKVLLRAGTLAILCLGLSIVFATMSK